MMGEGKRSKRKVRGTILRKSSGFSLNDFCFFFFLHVEVLCVFKLSPKGKCVIQTVVTALIFLSRKGHQLAPAKRVSVRNG